MSDQSLTIGQLAKASSIPLSTLRYYERKNILTPQSRSAAGYRLYSHKQIATIQFIHNAKSVGLSLKTIKILITLASEKKHASVVSSMNEHLIDIQTRINKLKKIETVIKDLLSNCEPEKPFDECPSLKKLFGFTDQCDI